jgi:CHAT domain-containing protein
VRVRVHADEMFEGIDVHALPFRGAPLAETVAVEYAVDGVVSTGVADPWQAVTIVGDSRGDLPRAREEVGALAGMARARDAGEVRVLTQGLATTNAVQRALADTRLFHFAGHGFSRQDGRWESSLALRGAERLSVADVLALPHAPSVVLLSACEGARADADGLGIAQAFVAAGTRVALAPTRRVADPLAEALSLSVFQRLLSDPHADGAQVLRDAQRAIRAKNPSWDWAAYRAIVAP